MNSTLRAVTFLLLTWSAAASRVHSWKLVGAMSQGDFDTIHHIAPDAVAVIANGTEHLYDMVNNGEVDAGLLSGMPDEDQFDVIPSGSISPRAMFTRPDDMETRRLVDAAIVRLQQSGKMSEYAETNQPFNYVEVHMCRSGDPDLHLPFPEKPAVQKVIKVGALGPYDWHQDGNYTADPPTGFWPDFYGGLQEQLGDSYKLERVWYPSSAGVMDALVAGDVDVTEGYWTVDSFYHDEPRTWALNAGCTTLGYQSNFFTKTSFLISESDKEGELQDALDLSKAKVETLTKELEEAKSSASHMAFTGMLVAALAIAVHT